MYNLVWIAVKLVVDPHLTHFYDSTLSTFWMHSVIKPKATRTTSKKISFFSSQNEPE